VATDARSRKARSTTAAKAAATSNGGEFNATDERALEAILGALTAAKDGDFSVRLSARRRDVIGEVQAGVNDLVEMNARMAKELQRLARVVGREGRMTERATLPGLYGGWADSVEAVNSLVDDLVRPTTEVGRVIAAVAQGDLSQKMALTIEGQPVKGEFSRIGQTVNAMVDQLGSFADEVTRVAREVGTDGKLGGQAEVKGVSGTWRDLTDSVNGMADNLTEQVRQIAQVTTAVANGDLTQQVTVDARGEVLELKRTINAMVARLSSFADEVTRVAREVGTEGELGGQAQVEDVSGTWRDLTESVNVMASNLTDQVRQIAQVTTAVANGDLTQKVTVEAKGEVARLAETINDMTDTLRTFAEQVTGVAREVGTLGVLGGQAEVPNVAGTWADLTVSVNSMATNLTDQVRNIAEVTTAVANGDLTRKITVDAQGEILELKNTINTMVDQLSSFADEVTRVAREVGTDGQLGGQAEVKGVSGTWRDLTENVNFLAANLTDQVRNIAQVTTAVAQGDLSQKITVDAQGEILELKRTINTMVDQLSSFADEVTRVAREVGTDGKLGGQAEVEGVSGTWRGLTENVNLMATNLTDQVRNIAQVTTAVANGDLTQKISVDARGEILELKDTINTMVDQLRAFASEVTRVAREVGTEGKLGGQAEVEGVSGTWRGLTENVNLMATNLTDQVRNIADVTTAVARGDLTRKITVDAQGEILELKDTINTMVDQLSSFADEVTRVAREVGTDGQLGGQAEVKDVSGTWRDLTENVNQLADNLTSQVRNIAQVTTAVAQGDLSQKITVDAQGEIAGLKDTINTMVDQLSSFADEVTRVAREVGTEGKLGGQAQVEDVSGTWRDLTENVNQLASNLTDQVRAMADVASSVTQGDLTRQITVEASGEVAELKDRVNQMIENLRDTTQQNAEQDWLKTNLARISSLMQGQRDLQTVSRMLMSEISPLVKAQHGAFFMVDAEEEAKPALRLLASYGYKKRKNLANEFLFGEGLPGQAALEMKSILVTNAPDDYVKVTSGLGEATPVNLMVLPILFEEQVLAVVELASLNPFGEVDLTFLDQLSETIGVVLSTIIANNRTEDLLEEQRRLAQELQSQSEELQSQQEELKHSNTELEDQAKSLRASEELLQTQQEELRQTNDELQEKAALLAQQNQDIEVKNSEIERARLALEERAEQLALSSRYKSEFMANMSHELRTPLNSLLILSKLLADNPSGNLDEQQVEFARTINGAGSDLLSLISDILDLSKVEAGKMEVHPAPLALAEVLGGLERSFEPVAAEKNLVFTVDVAADVPSDVITDEQRVAQILRNLLSNALKFTESGSVTLSVGPTEEMDLRERSYAIAFTVTDTGIGIAADKQRLIFEAFQQADGTTSRRYGGTGLGLSISREIARLLGGEIRVTSQEGEGSSFTLYLPAELEPVEVVDETDEDLLGPVGGNGASLLPASLTTIEDPLPPASEVPDDRAVVQDDDRVALVADSDTDRATASLSAVRAVGFKGLVALRPETAMALIGHHAPDIIVAGGVDLLERLKREPISRHIPVVVVADGDVAHEALVHGAVSVVEPGSDALGEAVTAAAEVAQRRARRVLVVDDDEIERRSVAALIGGPDVEVSAVGSSEEALACLDEAPFDCIVLDLKLPKASGFSLLERVKTDEQLRSVPVIIHTGKALTKREETRLKRYAESIIVKDAGSPERLLDETTLALHRPAESLPPESRRMLEQMRDADAALAGRKVLIVDDDVRNVFALTSALEAHGMEIVYAENGREALTQLKRNKDADLVLMDIMMPELDGYQTTEAIRQMPEFERLPIIALTAKAMKGDREKSIAAGASDYITKPVDIDQLVSLMRVWLYR
jgi:HAMP domain-containing protein/signal transduction histidine kinase/CheY-like chemotaxis protein